MLSKVGFGLRVLAATASVLAMGACGGESNGNAGEHVPAECEAGDTRNADDGCNECVCEDDGVWNCTNVSCGDCTPGTTRPNDCSDGSTCFCDERAHWSCPECSPTCPASRGDCDGDPSVCETNTDASISNCGACGHACTAGEGQVAFCNRGACDSAQCDSAGNDATCAERCELPPDAPASDPPFEGSCRMGCPTGTVCVASIVSGVPGGEYCAPLPRACLGTASCSCIAGCVCPGADGGQCDVYGAGLDGVSGPLTIACVRP